MIYATTYSIGGNSHHQKAKAKTTAPTVKRVRKMDAAHKGCKRSPKGQTTVCADSHVTNGFLRTSFLPKLKEAETVQACRKSEKTERDFYLSLSQLAEHYGIQPMQTKSYGYPYNMALALWDTQERLKDSIRDWEVINLIQDSN